MIAAVPQVAILLDGRGRRQYFPHETLSGEYRLSSASGHDIDAVELAVLWQTEGKGNGDLGVHFFNRRVASRTEGIDPYTPTRFLTQLPSSPLSYPGAIIKVNWYVRVRLFLSRGDELVTELPFRLGNLPDIRRLRERKNEE